MKKILGWLILFMMFVAFTVFMIIESDVITAVCVCLFVIVIGGLVFLAAKLITS